MNSLDLHKLNKGKVEVKSLVEINNNLDLAKAYTPGVAEVCRVIHDDKSKAYDYTLKSRTVAVVSDGSSVLGLGQIGPLAAIPVMEGKAILFKQFANIDAFPICLDTFDTEEIIKTVKNIAPCFGGINLEDISAPRCFEIERRLNEELDIPVFHDDQHGTAIAVAAGLLNALKVVNKKIEEISIIINGAGSAGISIAKLLLQFNVYNIVLVDRCGAITKLKKALNSEMDKMALITNKFDEEGSLSEVIKNKDVFIGVSVGNCLTSEMVKSMANDPIVFAMANPTPEIEPDLAIKSGARVVATGRSDFKNQINNVLVFPGIFKGAIEARVNKITDEMKIEAAKAISNLVTEEEIKEGIIIPSVFNPSVSTCVSQAIINLVKNKQNN